jgi:hypothetical protein
MTPVPPTATATAIPVPPTAAPPAVESPAPARATTTRPTPTRKPGVYYEDENVPFRLAVTWTPTPTPPLKHRS